MKNLEKKELLKFGLLALVITGAVVTGYHFLVREKDAEKKDSEEEAG